MKKGTWKKERAVGRKFSGGDEHSSPKAGSRTQYWVGRYHRGTRTVREGFRKNPNFRTRKQSS